MRYVAVGLGFLVMLLSDTVMEACRRAAEVFRQSVMPALFPMMILCGLMEGMRPLPGPRWVKYGETVLFSLLSGSPASARRVSGFVQNDEHFPRNALIMMAFCGVMSPIFFLGTLQSRLPKGSGLMLLLCHWAGATLTGLFTIVFAKRDWIHQCNKLNSVNGAPAATVPTFSLLGALPRAVTGAMAGLLSVLGAMMLMGIAASLLEKALCLLLPGRWQNPRLFAVLHGLMEIGGGAVRLSEVWPHVPLLSGLCGFGGLSVWMQCLLFLPKEIRPGKLLLIRLFHGAVSYGLCSFAMKLLGKTAVSFAELPAALASAPPGDPPAQALRLLVPVLLLSLLSLILLPGRVPAHRRGTVRPPSDGKPRTCSPHS